MNAVEAAVLGAIQGVTEFLPISSTAHLIIVPALLGWEASLTFHIATHLGTALAVILYFRADWARLVLGLADGVRDGAPWRNPDGRLALLVVLGTIPVLVVGVTLRPWFETLLEAAPDDAARLSASLLLVTGVILVAAERIGHRRQARAARDPNGAAGAETGPGDASNTAAAIDPARAMAVGMAQAAAILPGISRSGATIAAGLSGGLARAEAARFSFLLATPAILGAGLVQAVSHAGEPVPDGEAAAVAVGAVAAFAVGYLAIGWLLSYLRRASLYAFAVYTWLFGLAALWLLR